jgi:predicted nuclease of predicted toxin-antitoxin system
MRLLADQDVYALTVRLLRQRNHDVVTASELGLAQANDFDLFQAAMRDGRILVTRDRDFGGYLFVNKVQCGVIYLRVVPSALLALHDELMFVLDNYVESELMKALVVVEPGRHRIRRIPK